MVQRASKVEKTLRPYCRLSEMMEKDNIGHQMYLLEKGTGVPARQLRRLYHARPFPSTQYIPVDVRICGALMSYFGCTLADLFEWK